MSDLLESAEINKTNFYFNILDNLRIGGTMNMFGAPRYLQDNFGMDRKDALDIFNKWVKYADAKAREQV